MHERVIRPRPVPVRDWNPTLPAGTLRGIVLHWTAGDYASAYSAYHFCVCGAAEIEVVATHDLRANMRDVRTGDAAYAAHTQGRNSFTAGIAVCAMEAATPHDFGRFPMTQPQVDALCRVAATLMRAYGIRLDDVRTHAEAAVADGYFGADDADRRWDIARLEPSAQPLRAAEAAVVGDRLRARVAGLQLGSA